MGVELLWKLTSQLKRDVTATSTMAVSISEGQEYGYGLLSTPIQQREVLTGGKQLSALPTIFCAGIL